MRNYFLFILFLVFLSSCSKKIDGNSDEVKSLVLEIVEEQMYYRYSRVLLSEKFRDYTNYRYPYAGAPSIEELKKIANSIETSSEEIPFDEIPPELAKEVLAQLDKIVKSLKITNVRTIEKSHEYDMVMCDAIVSELNNDYNISYIAQMTDDKKYIHVTLLTFQVVGFPF